MILQSFFIIALFDIL
jgi:hypothetical protein